MLLSEAAKTGRKFRRTSVDSIWYQLEGKSIIAIGGPFAQQSITIDAEQLIANDWEAEAKIIRVSKDDLMSVAKTLSNNPICNSRRLAPVEFMKLVVEELGLDE